MMKKWLFVLFVAVGPFLQAVESESQTVSKEQAGFAVQAESVVQTEALKAIKALLPDEVLRPRALLDALIGQAENPTRAGEEDIIELVNQQLGDLESYAERMAKAGLIAQAGVMLDDLPDAWLWRMVGWGRMARRMDQENPLHLALLSLTVESALEKGLPVVPEVAAWYSDSKKVLVAPPAQTIQMSDQDFLNRLKADYPGLEEVIAAREAGNLAAAKEAYAAFLRESKRLSDATMYLTEDYRELKKEADEMLEGIYTIDTHMYLKYRYGPVVGVYNEILDDLESIVDINKHIQIAELAKVYRGTRDPAYHEKLVEHWVSWYYQSPVPNAGEVYRAGPWRTLEAGSRCWRAWPEVMMALLEGPTSDEVLFKFAKRYVEHGIYLATHNAMSARNWYQVESAGLGTVGALFPEVDICDQLYNVGVSRILWTTDHSFMPDGFQIEGSPGYHGYPYSSLVMFMLIAKDMGREVPRKMVKTFNRAADVFVYMTQPDLILPPLQDQGSDPKSAAEGLIRSLGYTENPAWRFIVSGYAEGKPPKETSYAFPWAGYYVMRESWTPDSRYLVFDGGYYGAGHQHEDKLHFLLHAHGRSMITDPGIYSYRRDAYERYFRSSRAHNAIIIDGKEQYRYHMRGIQMPESPDPAARWETNELFAFVSGVYNEGYRMIGAGSRNDDEASLEMDLVHERSIFHPWEGFYLVTDRVSDSDGIKVREMEQLFKLAPIVEDPAEQQVRPVILEVNATTGRAITKEAAHANMLIVPVGPALPEKTKTYLGQTDPDVRGWVTLYGRHPSHDLAYRYRRKLPAVMNTLFFTAPAGASLEPEIKTFELEAGSGLSLLVEHQGHTDHLLISDQGSQTMRAADLEGEGEILWVRTDRSGQAIAAGTIAGRKLSWNGKVLLRSKDPGPLVWSK